MAAADITQFTQPLSLTPNLLRAVVAGRPDDWLDRRHSSDVFSPREAVAHLVLCEGYGTWIDRSRKILDPNYAADTDESVSEATLLASRTFETLLDEFEALRATALQQLHALSLTEADLQTVNAAGTCTVGQLLSTWVAHDLYHLGQMFKSFAATYESEIGPYQRYLNLPHFN